MPPAAARWRTQTSPLRCRTGLNRVDCTYRSVSGLIESHWRRTAKGIEWTVVIPPNTTAEVYLPAADGSFNIKTLGSGRHHLACSPNQR